MAELVIKISLADPDLLAETAKSYGEEIERAVETCSRCTDQLCETHRSMTVERVADLQALCVGMLTLS